MTDFASLIRLLSKQNVEFILVGVAHYSPYLRGAPPGLPFRLDVETMRGGLNFALTTSLGAIHLFRETCSCRGTAMIEVKRAADRPKDLEAIAELESLLEVKRTIDSIVF